MKDAYDHGVIMARVKAVMEAVPGPKYLSHLDNLVHNCASEQASDINNSGRPAQVEYLLTHGWTGADILFNLQVAVEEEGEAA